MSVMLYPCIVCVSLLMDLFVLRVDSVCELFRETKCAFTSPVRTECVMFVMCCMQCCMSVSAVLWYVDVLSRGGI